MFNKGAIELSLNFIVIIIISVVMFAFGITFIYRISSQAKEIQDLTVTQLDGMISDIACDSSERVCAGAYKKTINRGKFGIFGIKILNILDSQDFDVTVLASSPIGFKKDKSQITSTSPPLTINPPNTRSVTIQKNDAKEVGIGIGVPKNAVAGTYIFNIEITTVNDGELYVPKQKLYVNVP